MQLGRGVLGVEGVEEDIFCIGNVEKLIVINMLIDKPILLTSLIDGV